jgi:hypothetical protein
MKYEMDDFNSNLATLALQATSGNMAILAQNLAQQREGGRMLEQAAAEAKAKADTKAVLDKAGAPKRGRPKKENGATPANGAEPSAPPAG